MIIERAPTRCEDFAFRPVEAFMRDIVLRRKRGRRNVYINLLTPCRSFGRADIGEGGTSGIKDKLRADIVHAMGIPAARRDDIRQR